jgi:hypothetical protein
MAYWRMQLRPSESEGAIKHTVECLSAGYVGLDFGVNVPDLLTVRQDSLPESQRSYWALPTGWLKTIASCCSLITSRSRSREFRGPAATSVPRPQKLVYGFVTFGPLTTFAITVTSLRTPERGSQSR